MTRHQREWLGRQVRRAGGNPADVNLESLLERVQAHYDAGYSPAESLHVVVGTPAPPGPWRGSLFENPPPPAPPRPIELLGVTAESLTTALRAYEAVRLAHPGAPLLPWPSLSEHARAFWARVSRAAINKRPYLSDGWGVPLWQLHRFNEQVIALAGEGSRHDNQ